MLKIRDLGINVIPIMTMGGPVPCVDPFETTACVDVTCIKPSYKKQAPALKKPFKIPAKKPTKKPTITKKPTKKGYRVAGFGGDAVEQLKRQLREQLRN